MDELVEVAVSLLLNHFDAKSSMLAFEDALSHVGRLCLEAVNEHPQDPSGELSGFDFILISKAFSAQDSTVWGQAHRASLIWPGQIISMSVGKRSCKTRGGMSQSKGVETFYPGLDILGRKLLSLMLDFLHWASNLSQPFVVNGDTSGGRYISIFFQIYENCIQDTKFELLLVHNTESP